MCSLLDFPLPPPRGKITFGELESNLVFGSPGTVASCFKDHVAKYPTIDVSSETLRPSISRKNARSAFIETTETAYKRTVIAWYENGILGVLEELSGSEESDGKVCFWIGKISDCLLTVYNWLHSFHLKIFPHLQLPVEDMIASYSEVNDWKHGIIRALAWHPQTSKCAIALWDDSIRIFAANSNMVPILKHRLQKDVTSMAWKPYCSSILAVACHGGVLVWHVDPASLVTRPSSSCATFLSQKGPVTTVIWHPHGYLLASSSAVDTTMHVWEVSLEEDVPLKRKGGGGVSFIRWSPDGMRLFAATPSTLFRIWETQTWTCERWNNLVGHCQAACWSPDGSTLLFTSLDEPIIYYLSFTLPNEMAFYQVGGSKSAIPIVDLTQILIDTGFNEVRVGGRVQNMVWDKTGERLAVSFKDNSEFIAVFRTKLKPTFEIRPLGFIRGHPSESVQTISFHDGFQYGALLTVCWSSGRVSNIPFLFIPIGGEMYKRIPFYKRDVISVTDTTPIERTIFSAASPVSGR